MKLQLSPDSEISISNDWFVTPRANPKAEMRLFLFPYAGSGPSAFGKWFSEFDMHLEARIAHYPGRGSRYKEPPIKQMDILVRGLSQAIQPFLDKPFVLFGHSFGGLVAFELARELRRQNLPQPRILFISACNAPQTSDSHLPIHDLPDPEFLEKLKELNGLPTEAANNSELLELVLPILRADFEAFENYQYIPNELSLNFPIHAFGGHDDSRVNQEHLAGWAIHTNAEFKSRFYPGNHFFINTAQEMVIKSITTDIKLSHANR